LVVGLRTAEISGMAKRKAISTMNAISALRKKLQTIDKGTDLAAVLTSSARCAAESDAIDSR
jgi:hypothetical protein